MKKNKKVLKLVCNVALTCILVVLCVFIGITVYSRISGKSVLPYSVLWVLTESMEPTIPSRSYILVKNVTAEEIEVDDVITFRSRDAALNGMLNTHRVVEIIGDHEEFVTKGDNSVGVDTTHVLAQDVEAKYVCNLTVLTVFGRIFSSTAGFCICLALISAGVFFWFFRFFVKKRKRLSEEEVDRLVKEEVARLEAEHASERTDERSDKTDGVKDKDTQQ